MKYILKKPFGQYKEGHVFETDKGVFMIGDGYIATPLDIIMAIQLGILEEQKEEVKEEWPSEGSKYWFINDNGTVNWVTWGNDEFDLQRKGTLGIYRTEAEALATLEKIKKFIKEQK